MKHLLKTATLFMAAALVFGFVSCKSNVDDANNEEKTEQQIDLNTENEIIALKDCSKIKTIFEELCDFDYSYNKSILHFAKASTKPSKAEYYIDAEDKNIPLWYDEEEKTLFYYLEPGKKMGLRTSDGKNKLFSWMMELESIETSDFDTSNVTTMENMFAGCNELTKLDVSNFDTSNVTNMQFMFYECYGLTKLDVSNFDTSNVTNMDRMFMSCSKLTKLDVSNFDTSNVTNMLWMFNGCRELTKLDVSKFATSNVTNMECMFEWCKKLTTLDVSKFDTSNVTNMRGMFDGCNELTKLDVSNFDTSNVTDMAWMFNDCKKLTTIYASDKFTTSNAKESVRMFSYCEKLVGGDGTTYDESKTDMTYARIDGSESAPGYFSVKK